MKIIIIINRRPGETIQRFPAVPRESLSLFRRVNLTITTTSVPADERYLARNFL